MVNNMPCLDCQQFCNQNCKIIEKKKKKKLEELLRKIRVLFDRAGIK